VLVLVLVLVLVVVLEREYEQEKKLEKAVIYAIECGWKAYPSPPVSQTKP
jgi:hypothetical protein